MSDVSTRFACEGLLAPLPGSRRLRCQNDAKVQRDGKHYCLIHDPERKKERYARTQERYDREAAERALQSQKRERERIELERKLRCWDYIERAYLMMSAIDAEMFLSSLGIDLESAAGGSLADLIDAKCGVSP